MSLMLTLSYCSPIAPYISQEQCFFQLPGQNLSRVFDTQLVFKNDFVDAAGNVLYGGTIDNCKLNGTMNSSAEVLDMSVQSEMEDNRTSNISSDPLYICLCKNDLPDCSISNIQHCCDSSSVYPGETFQVSLIAVGQRNGTVPSTVRSTIIVIHIVDTLHTRLCYFTLSARFLYLFFTLQTQE